MPQQMNSVNNTLNYLLSYLTYTDKLSSYHNFPRIWTRLSSPTSLRHHHPPPPPGLTAF